MIIEQATINDAAEILALQKLAYASEAEIYDDFSIQPLTQTLDELAGEFASHTVFKAVQEERLVGSVRTLLDGGTCHVGKLIVHPEAQNQGIGATLMRHLEGFYAGTGRFELFTGHKSLRNLYLYEKLGYREFKRVQVNDHLRLVYMEKLNKKGIISMRISVILAHPDERSFNHAIAQAVVKQLENNGHKVHFHDLHTEYFDPLLVCDEIPKDAALPAVIKVHCKEIAEAEGIIIVHPNWWGQPPAILKGWVDRVIRPGIAYEFLEADSGEGVPNGLLKAKAAVVFNTTNTEPEREKIVFGDPLESIWKNCIFGLCGVTNFHRRMFGIIVTSSEMQRVEWLDEVRKTVDSFFPVASKVG